ncbi:MAG: hypothetical protein RQ968_03985 [Thermoproteota archaeon]|jgi:hypothetical protein|nr:hypothetical protein [Thermoproteota archaeon]
MSETLIYKKLPNIQGVTFEGVENIKLKSRESVKQSLESFIKYCLEDARKPALAIIRGEWGEGKTDVYERYIKRLPEERQKEICYAFFVSASTLSNTYERPVIEKLLKTTSLSAVIFLTVLFAAVREESAKEVIPDPQNYQDAESYLNAILEKLISKESRKKIFIFIDEFEELLHEPEKLRKILSGIKETMNGQYKAIDEGGRFEGCLHLIIAVTPDAYYKLTTMEDFSMMIGSFERRVVIIDLPQIRKEDGILFIYELLRYSYEDNIPTPFPFINFGICSTLFRVAQGNPGAIVSLFTRIMAKAKVNDKFIKVINGENLLKFLENETISIYGGSTRCLDIETFNRFLKIISDQKIKERGEKCSLLFRIIVGELKPFSTEELESRIGYSNVEHLINIINDGLRREEGLIKAILKVSPLRDDKKFDDIVKKFEDNKYIIHERDEKYIKIGNYFEPLKLFEDKISHFFYENGNIMKKIYLPVDDYSIKSFFEGISDDEVEILKRIISHLCKNETYYLASDEILRQIFPTPTPRELDFIKDRELRLKLWREISRNLASEYDNNISTALISLLRQYKDLSIKEEYQLLRNKKVYFAEIKFEEMKINCIFFPVNGDVINTHIEELWELLTERKSSIYPIHLVLLIFTGDITQDAKEKIEDLGIGKDCENLILELRIHPTLAKKILCIYNATFNKNVIDESALYFTINKLLTQELSILDEIKKWLKEQEKKGMVISDIPQKATPNLKEIADTLKFFINFIEDSTSIEEIFQRNQELLNYTLYASKKVALIPDIQKPKFEKIVEDLLEGGFIVRDGNKYKVEYHPVEKRILKILKKEKKLSRKELENFFIVKKSIYLSDVFIPILEYKGLIKEDDSNYLLTKKEELNSIVSKHYRKFKDWMKDEEIKKYGYIYITKERGERFISLTKYEGLIDKLFNKSQEFPTLNEEVALQKLSLTKKLLDHFFEELYPLIESASKKSKDILEITSNLMNDIRDSLEEIKEECNKWFKVKFEIENLEEYKKVKSAFEEIKKYESLNEEEVRNIIETFEDNEKKNFLFSKDKESAYYFNPKFYKIATLFEEMKKQVENLKKGIVNLKERIESFETNQKKLESALRNIAVENKYKYSYQILRTLHQLINNPFSEIIPIPINRFNDLLEIIHQNEDYINQTLKSVDHCIYDLKKLFDLEKNYISTLENYKELRSRISHIFDIQEYISITKSFEDKLKKYEQEYDDLILEMKLNDAKSILETINKLKEKIEELYKKLKEERKLINVAWEKYKNTIESFISNVENFKKLSEKLSWGISGFENEIERLKEIAKSNIDDLYLSLSGLEKIKQAIEETIYTKIKDKLNKKEFDLLNILLNQLKRREWIPLREIYEIASQNLKLESAEIEEILEKFIKLRIIEKGITKAF